MSYTVITGGTSGIGYHVAKLLADKEDLIVVARDEERLSEVAAEFGDTTKTYAVDLEKPGSGQTLYDAIQGDDLTVSKLINNAGYGKHGGFTDIPLEEQTYMTHLNCVTPLELTHLFLQHGLEQVVNIASTAAYQPGPYMATYYATKWYVYAWSTALHEELKEETHVLTVCPGPTKTSFEERASKKETLRFFEHAQRVEDVAEEIVSAMGTEKAVVTTGWRNKVFAVLSKFLPLRLKLRFVGDLQRPEHK